MIIPCVRKGNEEQGIIWLSVTDITHLARKRNEVEFHTADGVYVRPNALDYWQVVLKEKGFERLDWGVLVNLHKIAELDEKEHKIIIKDSRKSIVVAEKHIENLKEFLKKGES
ncbi:hypothetical protein EDM57_04730 [Brevibacillus gelatini]|uniref:HTH LytTR-type domain-containing protein n=1 Tax=Brevibacillus gelatini TaxID=1655277 RepID=A0A3M8B7M2_9BACL|nr:LytTR family transcriptional regulator DNA-binding domain-containing protein [Brevibacillus gelatini]RNB59451.1 hypothetical protein EDM57_04730 [Brevibacillus gelatini]